MDHFVVELLTFFITRTRFLFNQSILQITQNTETQYKISNIAKKPCSFYPDYVATNYREVLTDLIPITVEYKYANYFTFEIKSYLTYSGSLTPLCIPLSLDGI